MGKLGLVFNIQTVVTFREFFASTLSVSKMVGHARNFIVFISVLFSISFGVLLVYIFYDTQRNGKRKIVFRGTRTHNLSATGAQYQPY